MNTENHMRNSRRMTTKAWPEKIASGLDKSTRCVVESRREGELMSASHVNRAVGVLLFTAKPTTHERGCFPLAFTTDVADNACRFHRNRPARVGYSDAEPARAGEGEHHE
jgi:hypothetical protein